MSNIGNQVLGNIILGAGAEETFTGYSGQAQADIKATSVKHGQCQANIAQRYFVSAQCQARIGTVFAWGQSNADIKQTYPVCVGVSDSGGALLGNLQLGQAQLGSTSSGATTCEGAFGQAQATISVNKYGSGQCQADIKAVGRGFGQCQADIKQTYNAHGQTQADIKQVGYGSGQCQAKINAFGVCQFGQANCYILGAAQQYSQCQADIKTTYNQHGQCQADIKQTYNVHGQCQAQIISTYNGHGQCQADIKATTNQHAQCQADIKATSNKHGQCQATIGTRGYGHGQCQAKVLSAFAAGYGQCQATITAQYIHFLDTFSRTVATVDTVPSMNPPDYGIYSGVSTVNPAGSIDGSKVIVPYGSFEALYVGNVPVDIVDGSTLSMQFKATDYISIDDFYFEVSIGNQDVLDGSVVMYTDSGQIYLFGGTNLDSAPFVPGNGFTYKFLLYSSPTEVKAKVWLYDDGLVTYPEPAAWTLQTTNNVSFTGISAFFYALIFTGGNSGTLEIDNVSIYAPEPPAWLAFAQAQALIRQTIVQGQAKADIKATINKHGQTQGFIRKQAGRGQAQALITKAAFKSGQANAQIATPGRGNGQAQGTIITTKPNGQASVWILNTDSPFAQAQAYILDRWRILAQAQALIRFIEGVSTGLSQGYIYRPQGYGQAQAFLAAEVATGQANADIKAINRAHGQAQGYINKPIKSGQALGYILGKPRGHGQAAARIQDRRAHGQCLAVIRLPAGYGQCQGFIGNKTQDINTGQARAMIRYIYNVSGLTQAMILHSKLVAQANARIRAFGQWGFAHAQAKVLAKAIIQPYGQAQAYIRRSVLSGQAQGFVSGGRYLVRYNGYQLPGYAQSESLASIESMEPQYATFKDSSITEYVGLQNKIISLRMKVVGSTYAEVKDQVQEAATIMLSSRRFTKLYVQRSDRYYEAIGEKLTAEKTVNESMRTFDYNVDFHAMPWLTSDATYTVSGTGTVTTDAVGRTFSNGGWTPAKLIISGTNVTVSGYTATGDFTGFVSVSGTVSSLQIDAVTYTAEIAGVNYNNGIYNPDYAIFVGPGKTTFVITGATSCQIEWHDRWYL